MAVPNFPQPPQRGFSNDSFPGDLISGDRKFYTSISFAKYTGYSFASGFANLSFGGNIKLPMPRKLNDNEVMIWEEFSGTNEIVQGAQTLSNFLPGIAGSIARVAGGAGSAAVSGYQMSSVFTGSTINPFMFMMFKRPAFKEFTLQWSLAPTSQRESDSLDQIIKKCKRAALPTTSGAFMEYPEIANIKLYAGQANDKYLFKFKPCAIVSVQVDYTGAGMPSFFKSGAPTIVNLTLQLKEIELWSKNDDL